MTDYRATINGTWNPGSVPVIDPAGYYGAQMAATEAAGTALGLATGSTVDFHILSVKALDGPVYRARWKLFAYFSGPSLRLGTTEPHDSQISLMLREYPHSQVDQLRIDPALYDVPYRGVMAALIPALILRARWGAEPRTLTVGSLGTGTFTPTELSYTELYSNTPITVPYDPTTALASYSFALTPDTVPEPAMWLATEDGAWKISYCAETAEHTAAERWDDPAAPTAPAFDPLPAPNPVLPPPNYDY